MAKSRKLKSRIGGGRCSKCRRQLVPRSLRGGGVDDIKVSLGNCGRSKLIGLWDSNCITLIYKDKKVVLFFNYDTNLIEVRKFENKTDNVFKNKTEFRHHRISDPAIRKAEFNLTEFKSVISGLIGENFFARDNDVFNLIRKIIKLEGGGWVKDALQDILGGYF